MKFNLQIDISDEEVIEILSNMGYNCFEYKDGYMRCINMETNQEVRPHFKFNEIFEERLKKLLFKELFYI